MATYLCAVSGRFPENYHIGIQAGVWGVEEKYQGKIAGLQPDDQIVFLLNSRFRSIHRVLSRPFKDDSELWPQKDGSFFPHRVKIGPAIYVGEVAPSVFSEAISFMKDKQKWQGTVQGPNGVLNPKLTDEDREFLTARMMKVDEAVSPRPEVEAPEAAVPVSRGLADILAAIDLVALRELHRTTDGTILHCVSADRRTHTVVCFCQAKASGSTILEALREMSRLRQAESGKRDIRGLIFAQDAEPEVPAYLSQVPNLDLRRYRVTLALDNGDAPAGNGVRKMA